MAEWLAEYGPLLGALAALATVLALVVAYVTYRTGRRDRGTESVELYTTKSQELAARARDVPGLLDAWDLKRPIAQVPKAEILMKEFYALYHGIYRRQASSSFPAANWAAAEDEMRHFLSYPYVQSNLPFADSLEPGFGLFMRGLTPKRRPP